MYQVTIGNQPDTAHGIFMAMQEILYNMKINRIPMGKILQFEEDITGQNMIIRQERWEHNVIRSYHFGRY